MIGDDRGVFSVQITLLKIFYFLFFFRKKSLEMQKVSIKIICLMSFLFLSFNFVNPSFSISAVKLNFLTKHFQTADLAPQEAEIPEVQFDEFWPNEMDAAIDVSYQIHRQSEVLSWFGNISEAYMNGVPFRRATKFAIQIT